ncbi:MAG TPA: aspartate/glutamate racemase family protein [Candidatus Dormibacteraeota bacterium]|nr:aspartate/glutamate racemase family protein [Candidatus Dormibacteraeota bacterium]
MELGASGAEQGGPDPSSRAAAGAPGAPSSRASSLRVTYQSFGQLTGMEAYQDLLRAEVAAAAGPGAEVEVRCLDQALLGGKGFSASEALELPALLGSLAGAISAGAEAVAIANGFDPGLWPARELFEVPVLGLFETVAFHGLRMGARLGVLCSGRSGPARIQEMVARYGINSRVALPRTLGIAVPEVVSAFENDQTFMGIGEQLEIEIARLAADGAELVLIASGALGSLLQFRGIDQAAGLPILPNVPILVQELLAAAAISRLGVPPISRVGRFAAPPEAVRESLRPPSE